MEILLIDKKEGSTPTIIATGDLYELYNSLSQIYWRSGYGFKPIVVRSYSDILLGKDLSIQVHAIQLIKLIEKLLPNKYIIRTNFNVAYYEEYAVPYVQDKKRTLTTVFTNLYLPSLTDGAYKPLYGFHHNTLYNPTLPDNGIVVKGGYRYVREDS